ncbi:DUF4190 domain-containing protein [Micromonospora sp. NBC_01813]|uniref:DUF4190 domain-containing protein n=1 Tax=Micromonospora sp. NBC_01813 TaxID=2975988 RepID=UPI002DD97EFF|nr:DUF4190 domain-containing protein [Micromonospora sp. NBC_01813]WSA06425.1 DUF4190 domain-containing protein [Micromonospora sp. NBC_01813]
MKESDPGQENQPPSPWATPSAAGGIPAADPAVAGGYPPQPGQYPPPGQIAGGYPPPAGYAVYPAPRPTNSMALASFIVSLVSLFSCPLIGLVSVFLGRRARDEIRRTGEQGDGLAQAGVIIGWVGVGLTVLYTLVIAAYFGFFFLMVNSTSSTY